MYLFYAPDIQSQPVLPDAEAVHCLRVLRKQAGDIIDITDGEGNHFQARIENDNPKNCTVRILSQNPLPSPWRNRVEIAVAPTKSADRIEWLVEKLTEIGIDQITFLRTRFSERKELKTERIQKILVAAMKQSEKVQLPALQGMTDFQTFVKQAFAGQKFIAHCYAGEKSLLSRICRPGEDALILIGPEGDFSEEEVETALQQGFVPISLGDTRLRTETAALAACQTVHVVNQREGQP